MTTPAREVNPVDVAHRVCSANLSIRSIVFQAGFSIGPGITVWRHTCHRQTQRDLRAARHGPESAGALSDVSSVIEPRCMVTSCRQPYFIAPAGARFCTPWAIDLRAGRHRRAPLGARIAARGIYRDPVRSSRSHFVKVSGLRCLFMILLVPIPWATRVWALPFFTALCPSERYHERLGKRHKTLTDLARQMIRQVRSWLPGRPIVIVADSAFAAPDFLDATRQHATIITRLRLDAALYAPAPIRCLRQRGRSRKKGERLPALSEVLADTRTQWTSLTAPYWYGEHNRLLQVANETALWYHPGMPVIALRWVLICDPLGQFDTQAFILDCFVQRWQMEVTFEEARAHLGVETQRQWSDKAIARTTPCLLALYSMVTLLAQPLFVTGQLSVRGADWYAKPQATFSDTIASVRRWLWNHEYFSTSLFEPDVIKIPQLLFDRFIDSLCYAA
jgi:hypothetical protein